MSATLPLFLSSADLDNYGPGAHASLRAALVTGRGGLVLPFTFATADAAVLFTVPTIYDPSGVALRMEIEATAWEVTTSFAGGSSSAIGLSSSNTAHATKGDLLGGSGGDVAATLVSTGLVLKAGTAGADFGSSARVLLIAGDTIRFDRITSVFTSGVGKAHIRYGLLPTT